MPDPRTYEQVVPFKYFAEWVKTQDGGRRLEQEEIRDRYEAYRREKLQQLYTQFFNAHKEDDWFAERFEPERRKAYTKLLAERKAENLREFMADLQAGAFDRLTHTATTEQVMLHEVNRRDQSGANRLGSDDDDEDSAITHTLFIRTVPPSVPRAVLEEKLKDLPGYRYLALSEPRQDKQYQRFGWVRFEDGTDMEKTLESLGDINIDQFQFHFSRHTNSSVVGMRLTPDVVSSEERIRLDLKLVREAVSAAMDGDAPADHGEDTAMGDADADAGRPADGADGEPRLPLDAARRELDLLLEYLRRVHYYCYYCGHTADNAEDFARRCAKLHLRRALPAHRSPQPCGNWLRNMDNRNDVIIHPLEGERLLKEGGKSMERETDNILNEHINQLDEGRFRCLLCTKLFKGDAFVRKHIRNKHPEAVPETLVHEISFFNNFVREATHYIQLGTGGALATMAGAPGGGMRDRNAGFMPQMFPGMMIPGMSMYGPPRHANNGRGDPRAVRSYVDLDAPAEGEADFGF
ncbi:arsenite-resistance protein 2-domain-containing protein [Coemansia mojavensis]|nr:arsenite-resistance protein 2-domain-containing protein [Coemansia mojavensis]